MARLASAHGIQTSYLDASGVRRHASPDAILSTLRFLGAPIADAGDLTRALDERRRARWTRPVEPVLVAWDGRLPEFRLRLPEAHPQGALRIAIEPERHRMARIPGVESPLSSLPVSTLAKIGGLRYLERRVPLPGPLPYGYYRLRAAFGGLETDSLIVSAPVRPPRTDSARREWGVFAPTYALHSRRSWGIGDLQDLSRLAAWAGRRGATVVGTLPLHPTFLEQEGANSPYSPVSRLFLNEIYIALDSVPEFRSEAVRRLARAPELVRRLARCRNSRLVDYRLAIRCKRSILEAMSRSCVAHDSPRSRAFRRFLANNPEVADYARFRAVGERLGRRWQEWPGRQREGQLDPDDADRGSEIYHAYAQWIAHQQLSDVERGSAAAGVRLYFDLPLGVHPSGYDTYRNRELFVPGLSVGAPPDGYSACGQDWGFAPLHPERTREQGHRYLIRTLRQQLRYAHLLRLDHVMGLTRLFLVPEGAAAVDGLYVRYPEDEFYAVLCLEAHRARAAIIGEDLGTVPSGVRDRMDRHGVRRMYVLPYEIRPADPVPVPDPPAGSLACLNTHDMAPFAAFWTGTDLKDRERLGLLSRSAALRERRGRSRSRRALTTHLRALGLLRGRANAGRALDASLKFLALSRAFLVLVNMEDLWREVRPQNTPGTAAPSPNWRRRLRLGLEALRHARAPGLGILGTLRHLRPRPKAKRPSRRGRRAVASVS